MPKITFRGRTYALAPEESVLDALTRHNVAVPSSCRSGICQTCLMKAERGTPPESAQTGLRDHLKEQGYFMACVCRPTTDLEVALADEAANPRHTADIVDKTELRPNILRLRLQPRQRFLFRGGQFINLHGPGGAIRSYSIASASLGDSALELHVRVIPDGRVSGWLAAEVHVGDIVEFDGPHGDCYYQSRDLDQALLLIGTGTGLAPLLAVIRDALLQGHRGPIQLFHGGRRADDLYLVRELQNLAREHANFSYTPCVLESTDGDGHTAGSPADAALADGRKLKDVRVYLCGNPDMVRAAKRKAFLAGAAFKEIHTDPFEPAAAAGNQAAPHAKTSTLTGEASQVTAAT